MEKLPLPTPRPHPASRRAVQRPSRDQIAAAAGRRVPDLVAADLTVLFCGINPSSYSGAVGHHFARPGNRFWPMLWRSGFTDRLLAPDEGDALLAAGCGITNLVARATATAAELDPDELRAGGRRLRRLVRRLRPRCVAFLGLGAYRTAFGHPAAKPGRQPDTIGEVSVWALPNPSGLNAHYQLDALARQLAALREAVTGSASAPLPRARGRSGRGGAPRRRS